METAANGDIETTDMDVDRAKIPIRDRKRMVEVWSWHQAIPVTRKNHALDKAESPPHRMRMLNAF